jgi:ankyrin repeat protein
MSQSRTHYEVLGVPVSASADQIAKRYKELLANAKSNIATAPVDPDRLTKAREAYVVLTDPQKRAAYDRLIAAERGISAQTSATARRRTNFFARAWRGEVRAWKLFWLLLVPAWLIVLLATTWVGLLLIALAVLYVPFPVFLAIGAGLAVALLAGAVLLWQSAFNVSWRFFGYAGRICAVATVTALGLGVYDFVAGKSEISKLASLALGTSASDAPVPKERKLLVAAQRGDVALVKLLLDKGEDPNVRETERNNLGRTPLHYAAGGKHYNRQGRHIEVAKLLVERGADVNAKGDTGYTALHVASGLGQVELVDFLLKNGADVDAKDVRGTPLAAAALQGHEPVVQLLIERKANPQEGLVAFSQMNRYTSAHTAILMRLIDAGADPNEESRNGYTVFDSVIVRGAEDPVYMLVSHGVNLGPSRPNLSPRAFKLAEQGYVKTLELAFDKGFDPSTRGELGRTFIHVARTAETVDLLLAKGLRVDQLDDKRNQPLHFAVTAVLRPLCAHLLSKGAPINAANEEGTTPLMLASKGGGDEAMKLLELLLERGADVRLRDKRGYAALDYAAEQGSEATLKRLLEGGVVASARDANGYTALHRARSVKVAEMLVTAGASTTLAALDGKTPLHLAAMQDERVAEFLLRQGVDVNALDKSGQTPLYSAVRRGSTVLKLLEAGAMVNIVDNEGKTPLHYAAADSSEVSKILVGKGISLGAKDKFGNTPLHEAAKVNRSHLVRILIELGADPTIKNLEGKTAPDLAEETARAQAQKSFTKAPQLEGSVWRRGSRIRPSE